MSERLHIAKFTNVYLPTVNGVVTSVTSFRKALTELGHNVFVFAPYASDFRDEEPFIFRYPAVELPTQKYPLALPVSPFIDKLLPLLKPHVLHANHPALLGKAASDKARELNLPLVFTYHTRYRDYSHYASFLPQDTLKEFIEHWLGVFMTSCHHVVVPSQSIKNLVESTYGVSERVSVVATGVDPQRFGGLTRQEARKLLGWDPDQKILISSGRLAKEKNFDLLLKAVARVKLPTRLVILGEGEERKGLEKLTRDLGIEERVELMGVVSHQQVPLYLSAADLFVFASVTETQGLVTLEAMASGLPVVAVDASGTRDVVVEGQTGYLTAVEAEPLADQIEGLLANDQRRKEFAEASRQRASEFSMESQALKLIQVYQAAREAHRKGLRVWGGDEDQRSRWEEMLEFFRRPRAESS
ncbi:MAG: glycosyltransferase [Vulcanimicrobiota bacterium]